MKFNKLNRYLYLTIYLLIILFLVISSAQNGSNSSETSNFIKNLLIKIPLINKFSSSPNLIPLIRKVLGHFLSYAFLGIFSYLTYSNFITKEKFFITANLLSGFALSVLTEIIQIFAQNRGPQISDVFINYQGFLFSQLIIITLIFLYKIKDFKEYYKFRNLILTNFYLSSLSLLLSLFLIVKSVANYTCILIFIFVYFLYIIIFAIKYFNIKKDS